MGNVKLEICENIATLSIEDEKLLNVLSRKIVDDIDVCIETVKENEEIRCLILYSERNFAAGADVKAMVECNKEGAKEFLFSPTFNKIAALDIPVIAAMEGYALGGGLELALTADIRIGAKNSKMGFPEASLGIFPGAGGTVRAPRIIGEAFTKQLIFTGEIISADEAINIGLINKMVEPGETYKVAISMAKKIAQNGPVAISAAKRTIAENMEEANEVKAVENEIENWSDLFNLPEQKEGMRAFCEKRKPEFTNK